MKKRRHSKQRELILNTIKSTNEHPTAEYIYSVVRKEIPNISLGTVYRNLNILAEDGEIKKISIDPKNEHFDGITEDHCHFYCKNCNKIMDLDCDINKLINYNDILDEGDLINEIDISFKGICHECSKKINGLEE